tara:strand:+ start:836 stop:1411 length:576 start_codon:yes stop_codon:yes gene_type:complete
MYDGDDHYETAPFENGNALQEDQILSVLKAAKPSPRAVYDEELTQRQLEERATLYGSYDSINYNDNTPGEPPMILEWCTMTPNQQQQAYFQDLVIRSVTFVHDKNNHKITIDIKRLGVYETNFLIMKYAVDEVDHGIITHMQWKANAETRALFKSRNITADGIIQQFIVPVLPPPGRRLNFNVSGLGYELQ